MTTAVVFDLFHTLVDPEEFRPRHFDRIGAVADIFGVDRTVMAELWLEIAPRLAVTSDSPAVALATAAMSLGGAWPTAGDLAAAEDALGRYQDMALAHPLSGAVETLVWLGSAGVPRGLLSNAHERDVRAWDRSPLHGCFEAVVLSCRDGVAKPERAAYELVLSRLGVDARDAAFCGDGNGGELAGAREVGFGTVVAVAGAAVRSGFRSRTEMAKLAVCADAMVESVMEVPALLGLDECVRVSRPGGRAPRPVPRRR